MAVAVKSRSKRNDLVRARLMATAAMLFYERGYAQTGMEDIAATLDLGRSALYHYFRNKEEILAALVDEDTSDRTNATAAILNDRSRTATSRIETALRASIVARLSDGATPRVLEQLQGVMAPEVRARYTGLQVRILELYMKTITDGIESGEFRSVDARLAAFSVIAIASWTSWWYSPRGNLSADEVADEMVDFALHAIVRPQDRTVPAESIATASRLLHEALRTLDHVRDDAARSAAIRRSKR